MPEENQTQHSQSFQNSNFFRYSHTTISDLAGSARVVPEAGGNHAASPVKVPLSIGVNATTLVNALLIHDQIHPFDEPSLRFPAHSG
jgi:hypothetical protein